jgi:hypothetical protein
MNADGPATRLQRDVSATVQAFIREFATGNEQAACDRLSLEGYVAVDRAAYALVRIKTNLDCQHELAMLFVASHYANAKGTGALAHYVALASAATVTGNRASYRDGGEVFRLVAPLGPSDGWSVRSWSMLDVVARSRR